MSSPLSEDTAQPRSSRAPLWILITLCVAPIVASYLAYYWWPPAGQVNYGELIEPRALPDVEVRRLDGSSFRWRELSGKWALTVIDSGRCNAWCQEKLVYIRQVRLAQGRDADRLERVWLVSDHETPDRALLAAHEGLMVLRAADSDLVSMFPATHSRADHIYVVDPLGNAMMRYPRDADPRRMLKDVARLLRHSKWR